MEAEILDLYELPYSDLVFLSSDYAKSSSMSTEELQRLDLTRRSIMEALGPMGPGLLSVVDVPNAAALRRDLPLARDLSLLDAESRKRILKAKRKVSSFAMQLKYEQNSNSEQVLELADRSIGSENDEYKKLGSNLKKLGFCMMELGLRLARVCDDAIGGQELEQSLVESCAAKGRLIHYHSELDRRILLKQSLERKVKNSKFDGKKESNVDCNLWQQWHYDYGIFTVLTAPMFLLQSAESHYEECGYPNGHTFLQIYDPNKKRIFKAKSSPVSFIFQVGESAEVISKGNLRATLHSVGGPPAKLGNLSRETFVVFLQPPWDKVLRASDCLRPVPSSEEEAIGEKNQRIEDIEKIVPPLSSRLKDGMTFAEFSRETTKQYYGGSGLQSNR
ncbi:hypothetical protein L484_002348 [Morus notabilis]|uniref:Isopenicillin N synthase-like Fe(2+) 2OG dioxygenase domain-containing protein n=1 Tax=Morus notabilis TaxID=981085 RepID=W9RCE8_9ROSA|nr:hypothetical protein L484_002348 [Morus notabilis]